jgi:hypothetical protein
MCPQSVKVLPYSQFVDTSFWVKGPVSTKCECDVLQTLCGHTFPRQGSCVHKVSKCCPTASLWTHLSESRVMCPQSVKVLPYSQFVDTSFWVKSPVSTKCHMMPCRYVVDTSSRRKGPVSTKCHVMPYRDFADTSSWVKGPVSTKCECDVLQTPCGHIFLSQESCVHKVWMWCPTDTLWTHLAEAMVLCPQSVNVMPYIHLCGHIFPRQGSCVQCQCDVLQTFWGHIFPRQGSRVHKLSIWFLTDTLWTYLPEKRALCSQSVRWMACRHFMDTNHMHHSDRLKVNN